MAEIDILMVRVFTPNDEPVETTIPITDRAEAVKKLKDMGFVDRADGSFYHHEAGLRAWFRHVKVDNYGFIATVIRQVEELKEELKNANNPLLPRG